MTVMAASFLQASTMKLCGFPKRSNEAACQRLDEGAICGVWIWRDLDLDRACPGTCKCPIHLNL